MKQNTVLSLFFLGLLLIICNSCTSIHKEDNTIPVTTQKKIDSLNVLYELANTNSSSQQLKLTSLDHFIKGAITHSIDSLQYKGYMLQTKLLNTYGDPQKAIDQSYLFLALAQQNSDSIYISKALYKIGYYNKKLDNYLKAFDYYNQSFKIRRNIRDSISAGRSLFAMSNIQITLGDYNASIIIATDGLKYLENYSEYKTIAGLYHNISIAFKELGNHDDALLWNTKIMNFLKDSVAVKKIGVHNIPTFKNTRGNILAKQQEYQKSITILESILTKKNVINTPQVYSQLLNNLGYIKYLKDPDNNDSEEMLLQALTIRQNEKDSIGLFASNIHLTKYYKDTNIEKAKYHAYQAYYSIKNYNTYESLLEALTLITELNPNSIVDHQRFKEVSLKLMELRKKTREIYAPTRFENESLLKENQEKNKKIATVRNQNAIYLLSILVLLMGVGFVVYFFRQRTKNLAQQNEIEKFKASYETETRIAKRLHDEIGNDIFQVMLQYENDPHDPIIKEKLNTSYIKARDISRENNEFEIGETFPEELRNMLQNYTLNGIKLISRGFDTIQWPNDESIRITIYRVLQELMTNMQKHSKASLVVFVFSNLDDVLTIKYSDNGVGVPKENLTATNGLRNIEKRIEAIAGTLTFISEKDKGFKAEIKVPNLKKQK